MVGLLTITHNRIGHELIATADAMLGGIPLQHQSIEVLASTDPDAVALDAERIADQLDVGDGVLVLTDIYGSTPSNIAHRLQQGRRLEVVTGISLPMVTRALNYASLDLERLTEKALSGGHDGILHSHHEREGA